MVSPLSAKYKLNLPVCFYNLRCHSKWWNDGQWSLNAGLLSTETPVALRQKEALWGALSCMQLGLVRMTWVVNHIIGCIEMLTWRWHSMNSPGVTNMSHYIISGDHSRPCDSRYRYICCEDSLWRYNLWPAGGSEWWKVRGHRQIWCSNATSHSTSVGPIHTKPWLPTSRWH